MHVDQSTPDRLIVTDRPWRFAFGMAGVAPAVIVLGLTGPEPAAALPALVIAAGFSAIVLFAVFSTTILILDRASGRAVWLRGRPLRKPRRRDAPLSDVLEARIAPIPYLRFRADANRRAWTLAVVRIRNPRAPHRRAAAVEAINRFLGAEANRSPARLRDDGADRDSEAG